MTTRTRKARPRASAQKVSGTLKGFAAASKSAYSTLLLGDIQKFVVAEEIRSGNDDREKHLIHVSEVTKSDWCPRQSYYKLTEAEETDVQRAAGHQLVTIWENGHDIHAKWQNWLAKMGELWGTWECLVCGNRFEATSPETCGGELPDGSICQNHAMKYCEVELSNPELKMVGHADGAVPRLKALIEVKSFASGSVRVYDLDLIKKHTVKTEGGQSIVDEVALWKSITHPLRPHLVQGLLYLWMCAEAGLEFDKIIFIYEWKQTNATKEFVVTYSPRLIKPVLAKMARVIDAVGEGVAPPRPEGFEKDRSPCKDCIFRTGCYEEGDDDRTPQGPRRVRGASAERGLRGGRRRTGREAEAGASADPDASTPARATSQRTRRPDRTGRPRTDAADDTAHQVGGVPGDAVGDSRGGRTVRRVVDGEGTSTVVSRRR